MAARVSFLLLLCICVEFLHWVERKNLKFTASNVTCNILFFFFFLGLFWVGWFGFGLGLVRVFFPLCFLVALSSRNDNKFSPGKCAGSCCINLNILMINWIYCCSTNKTDMNDPANTCFLDEILNVVFYKWNLS